ncbi:hypothetical protein [Enterobacter hormaechei]|uniref:hypothetical protein n=1 Tax=Enterobacter hormaechei TaxID=158836 RepID=UPI002017C805|nr:hypothetical protein [Enterobacter hormaechei]
MLIIDDAICESYSASDIKTMGAEINTLETDFKITLEGFTTEQEANNIGNFTLEAIRALTKNLNLDISKLKCVVVSYNFSEALQNVTSIYQHKSPREGANKRGNSSRLTQSFHFFMFEPIFSPVNALNQPI